MHPLRQSSILGLLCALVTVGLSPCAAVPVNVGTFCDMNVVTPPMSPISPLR